MDGILRALQEDVICQGGPIDKRAKSSGTVNKDTQCTDIVCPSYELENVSIQCSTEERLNFYTKGRPLRLNELQIRALEIISKTMRRGITQAEVAKQLSLDPRSFFHQLKALLEYHLVTRIPVSCNRSFTYLLHLSRLAPEDETYAAEGEETTVTPNVVSVRSRIVELLEAAPGKKLPAQEVYRLLGGPQFVRIYRRNISWLVEHGFIECVIAEELGGAFKRILKFKKNITDLARKPVKPAAPVEDSVALQELVTGASLERQIRDYIDASGGTGRTLTEAMHDFGIGRKLAYRIGDRLTNGKYFSDSDVVKVPEFSGKERRHRFFTADGQTRDAADVVLLGSMARDSVNRARRLKALLQIVTEAVIVESGKPLINDLQQRLNEQEFSMDGKTLKRMIKYLEDEGLIRTVVVVLAGANRTVLIKANLSSDDPQVLEFIEKLKKNRADLAVPPPEIVAEPAKEHKFKMQKYGYIFGILQRCRRLHSYLVQDVILPRSNNEDTWICETLNTLFRELPLSVFLKIIGVGAISTRLSDFLAEPSHHDLTVEALPPAIREELHRRRIDRHKTVVKKLMELLVQLGLAIPDVRYPSVAFRLPYQYRLVQKVCIMDIGTGSILRWVDLASPGALDEYWDWLASLAEQSVSVHPSLAAAYSLVIRKDSWQSVSPYSKAFKKALRRIILQSLPANILEEEMRKIQDDFEINQETLMRAYQDLEQESQKNRTKRLEERRAKKTVNRTRSILPRAVESDEDPNERSRKAVLQSFSASELDSIRRCFFILQYPRFRLPTGSCQWGLIETLYRDGLIPGTRQGDEIRTMIQRFLISFEQSKKMRRVELTFRSIEALIKVGAIPPIPALEDNVESNFAHVFVYFQDLFGRIEEIKKHWWPKQHGNSTNMEQSMVLVDEGPSAFDPEQNWRKMSRIQQFRHFLEKPSIVPIMKPTAIPASHTAEWVAIKKILAIPTRDYDATISKDYLQHYSSTRIDTAVQQMIATGLLTKGESARFRPRIPGGEFLVNELFVAIIDGCEWNLDNDETELWPLMVQASRGQTTLSFEMARSVPQLVVSSTSARNVESLTAVISSSLDRGFDSVWFTIDGTPKSDVLCAACKFVHEQIFSHPGISAMRLKEFCFPHLSEEEVTIVLNILIEAEFLEAEEGLDNYYAL